MNRTPAVKLRMARQQHALLWSGFFAGLTFFYGCSAGTPPTETVMKADLGVRAAREARAEEFAPMNLRSAREKLEKAKQAMAAKRYDDARRLAESAQVDAELAEAQAEARIIRRAVDGVRGGGGDAPSTKAERESRQPLNTKPADE
jgi:hypothetical protein